MNEINWLQQGWECPKCGAVMSPTTSCCVNCRGAKGGGTATSIAVETINIAKDDYPCLTSYTESIHRLLTLKVKRKKIPMNSGNDII